jgi:hypothetical protein
MILASLPRIGSLTAINGAHCLRVICDHGSNSCRMCTDPAPLRRIPRNSDEVCAVEYVHQSTIVIRATALLAPEFDIIHPTWVTEE